MPDGQERAPALIGLDRRGVLAVEGPDRVAFLQGLVSNDVAAVGPDRAVWAALLTPQGKFLHEFFIATLGEALLLDLPADGVADLASRLRKFKLRSKVTLADRTADFAVAAVIGPEAAARVGLPAEPGAANVVSGGLAFVDPRHAGLGLRLIIPRADLGSITDSFRQAADPGAYERLRLALGIPDGARDLVPEKSILLENGCDELHGVSWTKGCYMGQELTARTKYRGLVKKRLLPVTVEGPLPPPGTILTLDGKEAGEMRSGLADMGLALVRLEALAEAERTGTGFAAGEAIVRPRRPDWLQLP